jgi:hypothetical protein
MSMPLGSFTRRTFSRICCAALLAGRRSPLAARSAPLTWGQLRGQLPGAGAGCERRYRADAQVLLFSIPVLHRTNVGDGAAGWRETAGEDGAAVRLLEFTGRSAPERAAGLNRFGMVQELSRTVDGVGGGAGTEAIYFGLMTSSPEESAAEARKALHSNAQEVWFSAIEGRIGAGAISTAGARFLAPARTSPAERNELIERARQALSGAPQRTMEWHSAEAAPRPFLHALAGLLDQPGPAETRYAYNGRLYRLRVERAPDPKAASTFRDARLIPPAAAVTRISGTLCRVEGGKPIEFRLWIEEGAPRPLPLRIEYQPKSFLRLTFEAVG